MGCQKPHTGDKSPVLSGMASPSVHGFAGQSSGFILLWVGTRMLGVLGSLCSCRKPPAWVEQSIAHGPLLSPRPWDLAPPHDIRAKPAIAAECAERAGGACWRALLFVLFNHGCAEWLPGTIAPRGSEVICVSKHPPPLEGRASAWPLQAAGMLLLCGAEHFFVPPSVLPLISSCLLQLGL